MKRTENLNLPIYDNPESDIFKINDVNNAHEMIDKQYKELKNIKETVESTNPSANLQGQINDINASLDKIESSTISLDVKKYSIYQDGKYIVNVDTLMQKVIDLDYKVNLFFSFGSFVINKTLKGVCNIFGQDVNKTEIRVSDDFVGNLMIDYGDINSRYGLKLENISFNSRFKEGIQHIGSSQNDGYGPGGLKINNVNFNNVGRNTYAFGGTCYPHGGIWEASFLTGGEIRNIGIISPNAFVLGANFDDIVIENVRFNLNGEMNSIPKQPIDLSGTNIKLSNIFINISIGMYNRYANRNGLILIGSNTVNIENVFYEEYNSEYDNNIDFIFGQKNPLIKLNIKNVNIRHNYDVNTLIAVVGTAISSSNADYSYVNINNVTTSNKDVDYLIYSQQINPADKKLEVIFNGITGIKNLVKLEGSGTDNGALILNGSFKGQQYNYAISYSNSKYPNDLRVVKNTNETTYYHSNGRIEKIGSIYVEKTVFDTETPSYTFTFALPFTTIDIGNVTLYDGMGQIPSFTARTTTEKIVLYLKGTKPNGTITFKYHCIGA